MQQADRRIENRDLHDLGPLDGEQAADEHRADVLDAVRRAVGEEHGGCGRDRVHDTDHRFLRHVPLARAGKREDERAHDGGREPERVRLPGVELEAEEERRGGAQRGDLRERDVDEDDLAREHVHAQVRVDPREHQTHEEWCPEQREQLEEHPRLCYLSASASVRTL